MFVRTLAAFLLGLVFTIASALTFEARPPVEQFLAPPASLPLPPVSTRMGTLRSRPKVLVDTVWVPVKVAERSLQIQTARSRYVFRPQVVQPRVAPPQPDQLRLVPSQPIPPQPIQPHVVELAPGTNFLVQLAEKLSTKDRYEGDTFRAMLARPLIKGEFIIADRGSKVLGRIVHVQNHTLALTLTEINTTDGQRVPVKTDVLTSGPTLLFQLTEAITLTEKLPD